MDSIKVDLLAKRIWDYMRLGMQPQKADVIIAFGSHDKRTAIRAAQLYLDGYAPLLIFSGNEGYGRKVSGFDGVPEAQIYFDEAVSLGVPKDSIILESESTNSSENVLFTAKMMVSKGIPANKVIVVHKPYMERRAYATLKAQWPSQQPDFIVTSPQLSYDEYISDPKYPKDYVIEVMVGDLQRIREYPKLGYQIEQPIPDDVWQAYEELVRLGFDKHLIGQ